MSLLVSLEEAKKYLGLEESSSDTSKDGVLSLVLESLSYALEVYLGRYIIERQIFKEPHYIEDLKQSALQLNFYPIKEVTLISFNGYPIATKNVDLVSGIIYKNDYWYGSIFVDYTAGIAPDITSVPKDIKLAICLWAKEITEKDSYVKSQSLGDFNISYTENNAIPLQVLSLVEKYKRYSI